MREILERQFETVFGFKPYPFQLRVMEVMLAERKNILLHIPTGGGKTLAAVAPFVLSSQSDFNFPKKMIYSFPLRTLVNAVYAKLGQVWSKGVEGKRMVVQTGENPEDPTFLCDMILTTLDQSLSAFLTLPVPVSERMANINSGAIIGSYLVFDEFHLFDPERSFFTTVKMLEMLESISPFMIMTATLPANLIQWLCKRLNLELVTLAPDELGQINNLSGRKELCLHEAELTYQEVLRLHRQKTLVIVNTVRRAQKIFLELKKHISADTRVILLHSRFLKKDRVSKELEILELFKHKSKANVICIATQVVEVGLDISADLLLTENAPMDSLIQRMGRLARYANESGYVHIYKVTPVRPYSRERMQESWQALQEVGEGILTHEVIEHLLEKGLTDYYQKQIQKWESNNFDRSQKIYHAIDIKENASSSGYYSELIRKTDSVYLTIHQEPEKVELFGLEHFQVNRSFLYTCFPRDGSQDDWTLKVPISTEDEDSESVSCMQITQEQIRQHFWFVANPQYVSYDAELGLIAGYQEGSNMPNAEQTSKVHQPLHYTDILWSVHADNTVRAAREIMKSEMEKTILVFQQVFLEIPETVLSQLIELTLAIHDTGKLNQKWQQKAKGDRHIVEGSLSHTAHRFGRMPKHSAIGALVLKSILKDYLKQHSLRNMGLINVAVAAVATHHSSIWPAQIDEFAISKESENILKTIIHKYVGIELEVGNLSSRGTIFSKKLIAENGERQYLCYLLLVRLLRLSDQHSFNLQSEGELR